MNYTWDLISWLKLVVPPLRRQPKRLALLQVFLGWLPNIHTQFLAEKDRISWLSQFNSQQAVLASLLNDLFDATLRRINIVTGSDSRTPFYTRNGTETIPGYVKSYTRNGTEALAGHIKVYTINSSELNSITDFIVNVPSALSTNEAAITAWVNYYKFAGKKFKIVYI